MENIEYSLERIADLLMTITNSLQNQCQLYIKIGGLIVQIILAIITILYVAFTYKIMKANQKSAQAANEEMMAIQKQAATVLYYDLKSLEEYFILDGEMNSANVRYYNQWQDALGKCSFLGPSDIKETLI